MKILNKILILILGVCLSMGAVFIGGTAKVSAEKGLKHFNRKRRNVDGIR